MTNPQRDWLKDLAESGQVGELQRRAIATCLAERDAAWAICERLKKWDNDDVSSLGNHVNELADIAADAAKLLEDKP